MRGLSNLWSRRVPASLLTLASAALLAAGPVAAPAQAADPGSCAVRVGISQGGGLQINYTVRNKCSRAWNFAVVLPSVGRWASPGCQTLQATETRNFWSNIADGNWYVVVC
ncbi:hypothetical protein [Nonomuraea aurantiaca]|jgi:hypothetical protein|uniref:hypothetical protein n=1 Tax=Nonomuraea aurantiaca TaxID=2878562 RepID=UPI001CD9CE64|nr:hypothetical protein [Nonomuraea aurantiaca]MCA2230330.1 hypothetical protein [Nonomuraea aurantiaca]